MHSVLIVIPTCLILEELIFCIAVCQILKMGHFKAKKQVKNLQNWNVWREKLALVIFNDFFIVDVFLLLVSLFISLITAKRTLLENTKITIRVILLLIVLTRAHSVIWLSFYDNFKFFSIYCSVNLAFAYAYTHIWREIVQNLRYFNPKWSWFECDYHVNCETTANV